MQRLLIAALSAAFLASVAAPALADDYPACTSHDQDHCRVVAHMGHGHHDHHDRHHKHHHGHH